MTIHHDRRFKSKIRNATQHRKTRVFIDSMGVPAYRIDRSGSTGMDQPNRIRFVSQCRNAYGAKYVEIDEYTSEKRE